MGVRLIRYRVKPYFFRSGICLVLASGGTEPSLVQMM